MSEASVARRYAQALFNVALTRETVDIIGSELFQLKSFSDKDGRFINFLRAPQVLTDHKVAMVKSLFTTRLSPSLLSFLMLLIEKDRITYLSEIAREFEKLLEDYKGIIKAKVTTAVHIDQDYKNRLVDSLQRMTGKKIELIHKINSDIVGGIIVQLNHQVIDRSVRSRLDALKHDLMAVKVY
ncbi:MAG: ATP synthase F1 subunit delta [candidate division Zixibacteria bacterium]